MTRAGIVAGWLWWATFRLGVARGIGIVNAYSVAQAEVSALWGRT